MRKFFYSVVMAFIALSCADTDNVVKSPDGSWAVEFGISDNGSLYYCVKDCRTGSDLISESMLGLDFFEFDSLQRFSLREIKHNAFSESWTQPWGENKVVTDRHNQMVIVLSDSLGNSMNVRFRAFDDGVAFRYEYETNYDSLRVVKELTEFNLCADGIAWYADANFESYEMEYKQAPLSEVAPASTPFVFKSSQRYFAIHEAALYDFPEMVLVNEDSLSFKGYLAPYYKGVRAVVPGNFITPWRTIQLSDDAAGLINSTMILNLNESCKIEDRSWIKPQKYIGVWWEMHLGTKEWKEGPRHGATTSEALRYIDFAAENSIDGVLFEGWNKGWENWGGTQEFDYVNPSGDFDLDSVVAYAGKKGVSVWMHNETGGNIYDYESKMEDAFRMYRDLGIHYLKTGYAGGMPDNIRHHSQKGVNHYQKVVELAAKYQIALDVHEPIKETGIRRTWPNMMTREGARGMEWNAWSRGNSSDYLTILPFVRLLAGPMDYTPGVFDIYFERACADSGRVQWNGDNSQCFIKTTLARQIANWVIIYSPLQMACDMIENYQGHPAFEFFREFDPDCDWSEALLGEIGEYIVVARRAKGKFYVGAGTNSEGRVVELPLDFLEDGVLYKAKIYGDDLGAEVICQPDGTFAPDKRSYVIVEKFVSDKDSLRIEMAPDGGQAIFFEPVV